METVRRLAFPSSRPTAIDLFSGAGGLTLGLRQAGFAVLGAIENDPVAVDSYSLNHAATHVWVADIREVSASSLMADLDLSSGDLDLLAGCPPCQGFSALRTRRKVPFADDPRNDLIREFTRFAEALRPKAIMLENVPGLANDPRFEQLLGTLKELGYSLSWQVVDAADYGVPQRRHRLILLGLRGANAPSLPRKRRGARATVRRAIAHLGHPGESGDPLHDLPERRSTAIQALIRKVPRNGGSRRDVKGWSLACHQRCDGFGDVYGRMAWDDVAPTITSGCHNPSRGRFLHPSEHRAITLREAALLQTFPLRYRFSLARGKEHAALLIGNALPPRLIRTLGLAIRRQL